MKRSLGDSKIMAEKVDALEETTGRLSQTQKVLTTKAEETEEFVQRELDDLVKTKWEEMNDVVGKFLRKAKRRDKWNG